MIYINAMRAYNLIEQVVAGNEEFVYDNGGEGDEGSPKYSRGESPCCLVGRALFSAGVSLDQLRYLDDKDVQPDDYNIDRVDLPEGVELTGGARSVFKAAQEAQDHGFPWGSGEFSSLARACRVIINLNGG